MRTPEEWLRRTENARFALRVLLLVATLVSLGAAGAMGFHELAYANGSWEGKLHRVVIQIDSDDEKVMGHAISYSMNITRAYATRNEKVRIEIVANGTGIKLFADTSPLQQPLAMVRQNIPDIVFSMCDSSRRIAEQREGHAISLMPGARLVPFGIGRVIELEEAGWSYVHG